MLKKNSQNGLLFRDTATKKYTPLNLMLGTKKIAGYKYKELYPYGKNQLDISKSISGYINSSGDIVSNTQIDTTPYMRIEKGKTYTFSYARIVTGTSGKYYQITDLEGTITSMTVYSPANLGFTYTATNNGYIRISYYNGDTNWQFEEGLTATAYEPFIPVTAMSENDTYNDSAFLKISGKSEQVGTPTPESPISINSVSNFDLVSSGKNLYDKSLSSNILSVYPLNNTFTSTTATRSAFIACLPATTYTISKVSSARFIIMESSNLPVAGGPLTILASDYTASSLTVTTSTTAKYLSAFIYNSNYETLTLQNILGTVQFELGSTATAYEPYQGDTVNFPYTLRSLPGGTRDYIEIDNINKTAKLYRNVEEKIFNGTEGWTQGITGTTNYYRYRLQLNDAVATVATEKCLIISNYFEPGYDSSTLHPSPYLLDESMALSSGHGLFAYSSKFSNATLEEWEAYLLQQYNAGTPVTVQYKLVTATVTDLDYNEVKTYYPYTNIYTNATIQPTLEGKIRVIER